MNAQDHAAQQNPMSPSAPLSPQPDQKAQPDAGHGVASPQHCVSQQQEEKMLDIDAALSRLGGSGARKLLVDLARFFVEDVPEYYRKLQQSLEAQDGRSAERFAHSIKGLAATFDGQGVQRAALEVERRSAAGDLAGAARAMPELSRQIDRLHAALVQLIAESR